MVEDIKSLQKEEAIKRLELLNLHPNVLKDFKAGRITVSETMGRGFNGMLFWASDKDMEYIKEFEKEHDAIVYHAIRVNTSFGELLALLYVSKYTDEWDLDIADLKSGCPISYVINKDDSILSEFGSIGIRRVNGGLTRTA